ncbi:hypothetical protein [Nonomuraea sp. NPDC050691]|uniref:hypothetical protein n=1 Tax=Nonomuraea sp. NPDC050691 TaxID=3155661 RepID=UPI0033C34C2F
MVAYSAPPVAAYRTPSVVACRGEVVKAGETAVAGVVAEAGLVARGTRPGLAVALVLRKTVVTVALRMTAVILEVAESQRGRWAREGALNVAYGTCGMYGTPGV